MPSPREPEAPGTIIDIATANVRYRGHELARVLHRAVEMADQGRFDAAFALLSPALDREGGFEPIGLRAAVLVEGARVLTALGRYDEALARARRGLALAEQDGGGTLAAEALLRAGHAHDRGGHPVDARDCYEEALARFRRLGNRARMGSARNNLGIACLSLGEWELASTHFAEAIRLGRETGPEMVLAQRLHNFGVFLLKSGPWEDARKHLAEARALFESAGHAWGLTGSNLALGTLARLEGRLDEADALLNAALKRARDGRLPREEALALEFLGDVDVRRGNPARALERYLGGLAIGQRLARGGDIVVELLRRIARVELELHHVTKAHDLIEQARALAHNLKDRYEQAMAEIVAAALAENEGRIEDAKGALRLAVAMLGGMGERYERGRCLARLARMTEDEEEARRFLSQASACFVEVGAVNELAEAEATFSANQPATAAAASSRRPAPAEARKAPPGGSTGGSGGNRAGGSARPIPREPTWIGASRATLRVRDLITRAARTDLSILVVGETGTGKELVARAIHNQSSRASRPFVAVNCGSMRAELAISLLFGHRRGAFTGAHDDSAGLVEAADTGTLFLDEIGELPAEVQIAFLRFLESGEYLRLGETRPRRADVRIVGATHVDLRRAIRLKRFRADLFFRLHEIEIIVPPLRDRGEDILPLARHFMRAYAPDVKRDFDASATSLLLAHAWPGNVRELEKLIKRALALVPAGDEAFSARDLEPLLGVLEGSFERTQAPAAEDADLQTPAGTRLPDRRRARFIEFERHEIEQALAQCNGNKSRAADILQISRKTLYARMHRLGLSLD